MWPFKTREAREAQIDADAERRLKAVESKPPPSLPDDDEREDTGVVDLALEAYRKASHEASETITRSTRAVRESTTSPITIVGTREPAR